ncbi:Hypothetical Protein FCC1311_036442 [Hondaea fermentalgiana]|uniref:ADP-ribosylglycohydrolase n=1 Tax=Hondaea fermentalgiana TaxID=2315210 RepID=A0A2R5GFL5_9STRA|nr:Hypothetical Protein FCC1311_036442 [Hondaea fermentalgiana]|eukprot:GBG27423.1 Hypothetical Protein FCC1311_036442 [Hondaea fermentalgiana]
MEEFFWALTGPFFFMRDLVKGAVYGALIMDASAAPTHWMYGGAMQVRSVYGGLLEAYTKPVEHLAGSIMSKSNTGGGGRGGYEGDVIGKVIFHDKKKFWAPGADYHYHHMLAAGENTLEGSLLMRTIDVLAHNKGTFSQAALTDDYIQFMTTPNSHNDTYCGTCHRMFFGKFANGVPPEECPDNDGHNVDTCDALVTTIPVAFAASQDAKASQEAAEMVHITRDAALAAETARNFALALRSVARGESSAREAAENLGKQVGLDVGREAARTRGNPMTACYLPQSYPAVLVMVHKHAAGNDDTSCSEAFERAVWANANRGGENVGTGALIGALLGAECGFAQLPSHLVSGLKAQTHDDLEARVEAFLDSLPFLSSQECS